MFQKITKTSHTALPAVRYSATDRDFLHICRYAKNLYRFTSATDVNSFNHCHRGDGAGRGRDHDAVVARIHWCRVRHHSAAALTGFSHVGSASLTERYILAVRIELRSEVIWIRPRCRLRNRGGTDSRFG